MAEEKRINEWDDGESYTWSEFNAVYKAQHNKKTILRWWNKCKVVAEDNSLAGRIKKFHPPVLKWYFEHDCLAIKTANLNRTDFETTRYPSFLVV